MHPPGTNQPFFTIVIPSLNEEKLLPLLLNDLAEQTDSSFEVVHVDGSSNDNTVENAQSFSEKIAIQTINSSRRNVAHQRNLGSRLAAGKWIIFLDADTRIPNHFLEKIRLKLAAKPDCGLFTCLVDQSQYAIKDQPIILSVNAMLDLLSRIKPIAPGAMIGVSREIIQEISFNESMPVAEDYEFVEKAIGAGHIFVLFKEPRYIFSLRRLKKDGLLNLTRVSAQHHLTYFFKDKKFSDDVHYPMTGGTYHQVEEDHPGVPLLFKTFRRVISELPSAARNRLFEK